MPHLGVALDVLQAHVQYAQDALDRVQLGDGQQLDLGPPPRPPASRRRARARHPHRRTPAQGASPWRRELGRGGVRQGLGGFRGALKGNGAVDGRGLSRVLSAVCQK